MANLVARGYVDDQAFAASWAEWRARGRAVGSRRLAQELHTKGVAGPVAEAAIRAAFAETDELARAGAAARRRWSVLGRGTPEQAARRLHDYLARRGYPASVVRQVVREIGRVTTDDAGGGDD